MYKPGKEKATRIELRCPDPACNPYLTFAVMLAAGLKGIEENYKLPEPVEEDIFEMSEAERERRGIASLPGSLDEAIVETEKSALVKEALGDHVFSKFIENKKIEWDNYRVHVSQYELDRLLLYPVGVLATGRMLQERRICFLQNQWSRVFQAVPFGQ